MILPLFAHAMPTVRPSNDADLPALLDVHRQAFGKDEGPEIVELVRALLTDDTAAPVLSLVAEKEQRIEGHVVFSAVRIEGAPRAAEARILAPLAVLPAMQNQGVGGALVREGLRRLAQGGVGLVFVLGHPSYYPRFGFRAVGDLGLTTPHPLRPEHRAGWMVQALQPGLLGKVRGKVICARALDEPGYW